MSVSSLHPHPHPHLYGVHKLLFASWPQGAAVLLQLIAPHTHYSRTRPTTAAPLRKKTKCYLHKKTRNILTTIWLVLSHFIIIIHFVSKCSYHAGFFFTEATAVWWWALWIQRADAEFTSCGYCQLSDLATHAGAHHVFITHLVSCFTARGCVLTVCVWFRTLSVWVWPLTTSKPSGLTWKFNGSSWRERGMRRRKEESREEANEESLSPSCAKDLLVCK